MPEAKTVSCGLWIKQGSVNENSENNGLSHLVEHLLLNAANDCCPKYQKYMDMASKEGVVYNAATTKEYTCFYYTGLPQTLETCLDCLACIAKENREFPAEFFEKEKNVVLQEATSYYSSFQQIKERTSQTIIRFFIVFGTKLRRRFSNKNLVEDGFHEFTKSLILSF